MKTIFNTYIKIESQQQADRLKQVCIDNGLPYWNDEVGFYFMKGCVFAFNKNPIVQQFYCLKSGFIIREFTDGNTQVTETEWMQLLKEYKS